MFNQERQQQIRELLGQSGKVLAAELAVRFGVSEDTVRRDLRELADAGACVRVYGGALAPAPDGGAIRRRLDQARTRKQQLANAAATLVRGRQVLFIDAGSTNVALATALPRDVRLTVATNAPAVALALADHANCTVSMLPGTVAREAGACVGARTVTAVGEIVADICFLGTCGVDTELGVTAFDAEEADVKRAMVRNAGQLVIIATAEKLGTAAPFKITPASTIDDLITEGTAPRQLLQAFENAGSRVTAI